MSLRFLLRETRTTLRTEPVDPTQTSGTRAKSGIRWYSITGTSAASTLACASNSAQRAGTASISCTWSHLLPCKKLQIKGALFKYVEAARHGRTCSKSSEAMAVVLTYAVWLVAMLTHRSATSQPIRLARHTSEHFQSRSLTHRWLNNTMKPLRTWT